MKLIRIDISNIAYTEKSVFHGFFFRFWLKTVKNYYLNLGFIKMAQQRVETCLSTFGKPGEALFKVYIPTNIPIEGNDEIQYLEHFTIKQCVSDVTPFDEHLLPKNWRNEAIYPRWGLGNAGRYRFSSDIANIWTEVCWN